MVVADNTVTGSGVILARRLEQQVAAGQVGISTAIREAVPARPGLSILDKGIRQLKGFSIPQHIYLVSNEPLDLHSESGVESETDAVYNPEPQSIAVLPFNNMSGDPEQEYFSDGISEDIITALCRVRGFFVIARNTTFTYKGRAVDVPSVARELGVRYVLEGSVRKAGNRLRITGQLIDGKSGSHLWGEKYDRELEDIFDLPDEITRTVIAAIEPELTRAEWKRAMTKKPEHFGAWDCVVQANALVSEFSNQSSSRALELLRQAITIGEQYARAHAHLAWVMIWRAFQGWEDMETAIGVATLASQRSIQLDANEP